MYFVTFSVQNRRWFFVTPERAKVLGQAIQTSCEMKGFALFGYCVLPNHVHVMVRPRGETVVGNAVTSPRTLERVRCENEIIITDANYLFPQRRLSSRRCGRDKQYNLSNLMQSIKGSFSRTMPKGKFWQHRSNFRLVSDQEDFNNKINYIQYNYRKMDLPEYYGRHPWVWIDHAKIDQFFNNKHVA